MDDLIEFYRRETSLFTFLSKGLLRDLFKAKRKKREHFVRHHIRRKLKLEIERRGFLSKSTVQELLQILNRRIPLEPNHGQFAAILFSFVGACLLTIFARIIDLDIKDVQAGFAALTNSLSLFLTILAHVPLYYVLYLFTQRFVLRSKRTVLVRLCEELEEISLGLPLSEPT